MKKILTVLLALFIVSGPAFAGSGWTYEDKVALLAMEFPGSSIYAIKPSNTKDDYFLVIDNLNNIWVTNVEKVTPPGGQARTYTLRMEINETTDLKRPIEDKKILCFESSIDSRGNLECVGGKYYE